MTAHPGTFLGYIDLGLADAPMAEPGASPAMDQLASDDLFTPADDLFTTPDPETPIFAEVLAELGDPSQPQATAPPGEGQPEQPGEAEPADDPEPAAQPDTEEPAEQDDDQD